MPLSTPQHTSAHLSTGPCERMIQQSINRIARSSEMVRSSDLLIRSLSSLLVKAPEPLGFSCPICSPKRSIGHHRAIASMNHVDGRVDRAPRSVHHLHVRPALIPAVSDALAGHLHQGRATT